MSNKLDNRAGFKEIFSSKDELSFIAHELRAPLNGIIALTDVLNTTPLDSSQQKLTRNISESALKLHAMFEQVLNFSRLQATNPAQHTEQVDLPGFFSCLNDSFASQAAKKNINYQFFEIDNLPQSITINRQALEHILVNLVGNALKYTNKGWIRLKIGLRYIEHNYHLYLTVIDTGIGMSQRFAKTMFQPYKQAAQNNKTQGVGLGMTIVKRYVDIMGGSIDVTTKKNQGTHITVLLPISMTTNVVPVSHQSVTAFIHNSPSLLKHLKYFADNEAEWLTVRHGDDLVNNKTIQYDIVHFSSDETKRQTQIKNLTDSKTQANLIALSEHPGQLIDYRDDILSMLPYQHIACLKNHDIDQLLQYLHRQSTIETACDLMERVTDKNQPLYHALVVDDDKVTRLAASKLLENNYFIVTVASGLSQAEKALKSQKYDLLLVDVKLGTSNGLELVTQIRERQASGSVRIIVMSGNDDYVIRDAAQNVGADSFIQKPFTGQKFIQTISKAMRYPSHLKNMQKSIPDTNWQILRYPQDIFSHKTLKYHLLNGESVVMSLIELFVSSSKKTVNEMQQMDRNDLSYFTRTAHKLRSSAQHAGIHVFESVLDELEHATRKRDIIRLTRLFIDQYYQQLPRIELIINDKPGEKND